MNTTNRADVGYEYEKHAKLNHCLYIIHGMNCRVVHAIALTLRYSSFIKVNTSLLTWGPKIKNLNMDADTSNSFFGSLKKM